MKDLVSGVSPWTRGIQVLSGARRLTAALAFVALLGCKGGEKDPGENLQTVDGPVAKEEAGEVTAARVCDAYEACRCGELAGVSLAGCETGLGFSWAGLTDEAESRGLTYDGECVADRINAIAARGCALPDERALPFCSGETCQVYHGTKADGEECESVGRFASDCAQGLVCLGVCSEPCANFGVDIPEGGVCNDPDSGFAGLCAEGLLCEPQSGMCVRVPTDGEECLQNFVCAEGHWCSMEGETPTCRPTKATGDPCNSFQECETLNCVDGACAAAPGEGDSCTLGRCAEGLVCDASDGAPVCIALPKMGEACLENPVSRCAEGLTCRDDVCTGKPGDGQSCEPGADGLQVQCKDGLICGVRLCRLSTDAPGCDACADGDEGDSCTVRVCHEIPPAVCGDGGGLGY